MDPDQIAPSGATGDCDLAYQPDLYVVNRCVPLPTVDEDGKTKQEPITDTGTRTLTFSVLE